MIERPHVTRRCRYIGCSVTLRIRRSNLNHHSGLCRSHARAKRPFESTYNRLFQNNHRNISIELTYKQFLQFVKVKNCVYCGADIIRNTKARALFLDRKDSSGPYSKSNCVVCCTTCNRIKTDILTYEEMKAAMRAVVSFRRRNGN